MANAQKKSKNKNITPKKQPLIAGILIAAVLVVAAVLCFGYRQANALNCEESSLPVKLSADGQAIYSVTGWLCARGNFSGKTVQLLVSGVSYDHNYWDFPYQSDNYSYVQSATKAGYATFN